jgi:hypothetical protein
MKITTGSKKSLPRRSGRKGPLLFTLGFVLIGSLFMYMALASPGDLEGDVNDDNVVNVFDLSTLLSNWGQTGRTWTQGDLNADGTVNIFDLSVLLTNWGNTGNTGNTGGLTLPAPINPGDRDFGRIVRTIVPNGGVIVLPDGEYTVSDISNFNPADYVVVVAQNPLGAKVVRSSNTVGQTDQYLTGSSKLIFVGIEFKNIVTRINDSDDTYFWRTRHTFPIATHPDPDETYCGNGTGPDGIEIGGGSIRTGIYGADIDDIGHDALKMSGNSNVTIRGSKVMNVWHGNLQQGRGNSRCGWDGNDNYHVDGLQIFPGGVSNLTMEHSYIGRHTIPQVDTNGSSNTNLVFRNNMFYEEPPYSGCLAFNARVKTGALAGAIQSMTVQNNDAWCADSQWLFYVEGSRDNALIINGEPIPATAREANRFVTRRTGAPDRNNTPAESWRSANPYDSWPCYFQNTIPGFTQSVRSC